jgi:holo-[acyl-carrier protein] synthase
MRIVGHGIDLVHVERIEGMIERHEAHFLERCFTEREQAYCEQGGRRRAEHYAARFAAKESVLKALGRGLRSGMTWTQIEVVADAWGRPGIELQGDALALADEIGVIDWQLSLTHVERFASASVIAIGESNGAAMEA